MINFKSFLLEAAVDTLPTYTQLSHAEALKIAKSECSNALTHARRGRFIYRGSRSSRLNRIMSDVDKDIAFVDSSKTERRSQNTSNHCTVMMDYFLKDIPNYPLRSRSLICTTDSEYATEYGNIFIVLPFDDAKIGLVNLPDMFDTELKIPAANMRKTLSIPTINRFLQAACCNNTDVKIDDIKKFCDNLKDAQSGTFDEAENWARHYIGEGFASPEVLTNLWQIFSEMFLPKNVPHEYATGATYHMPILDSEVWVQGRVLMLGPSALEVLKNR